MKSLGLVMSMLAVALLLGACASAPSQPQPMFERLDVDKMAAVDAAARENGVTVIWVNPPKATEDR